MNDYVGLIASDVPDSLQSYEWTIDSLHEGSGSSYKIEIQDTKVDNCKKFSPIFDLIDEEVCRISVGRPETGTVVQLDDVYNIEWTAEEVDGALDIYLYYDGERIDVIATNVNPDLGVLAWTVWIPVVPEDNKTLYRIVIVDNANLVAPCEGRSDLFLVTD